MKFFNWLRGHQRPRIVEVIQYPANEIKQFDLKLYEAMHERQEIERRLERSQPSGTLIADTIGGRVRREE